MRLSRWISVSPEAYSMIALSVLGLAGYAYEFLRLRRVPELPSKQPMPPTQGASVSVIVPARNEAATIMTCLQGLEQQFIANLELVLVDDQSQDQTAELARSFVAQHLRICVIDGAALPEGWLGKSWACWQGAAQAHAEWLLFVDADVQLEPAMLRSIIAYAHQEQLDMLSLLPRIVAVSLLEQMVLPAFFYLLMGIYPFEQVHDPRRPAFALGQCVLIRRRVYEQLGGHAAVRNVIIEDVALAELVRQAGYRIAMRSAPALLSVRMYDSWAALTEGMTKHASVGMGHTGMRAFLIALRQAFLAWLPLDMLVLAALARRPAERGWLALAAGCLLAAQIRVWAWAMHRHFGLGWREALLMPAGTLLYFLLASYAMLRLRLGLTMRWKGRAVE